MVDCEKYGVIKQKSIFAVTIVEYVMKRQWSTNEDDTAIVPSLLSGQIRNKRHIRDVNRKNSGAFWCAMMTTLAEDQTVNA